MKREDKIMNLINEYGWIDGAHHKQWVLTEIVKIILTKKEYSKWSCGDDEYDKWDEGVAP